MHTISTTIHKGRGYFTGVVAYWRRGEVWVFRRSFATEAMVHQWAEMRRAGLEMYGPELQQAAE